MIFYECVRDNNRCRDEYYYSWMTPKGGSHVVYYITDAMKENSTEEEVKDLINKKKAETLDTIIQSLLRSRLTSSPQLESYSS